MAIDRASPDDMMALASDRGAVVPLQIGVLLQLDPEHGVAASRMLDVLGRRAAAVPRLRQLLAPTPVGCGRPIWVEDRDFTPGRHLDTLAVRPFEPRVGDHAAPEDPCLDALAALVLDRLPRDRPPWRARVLLDPSGAAVAVAVVLHHVLADGVGGLALLAALLDPTPSAAGRPSGRGEEVGADRPTPRALARDAWSERRRAVAALPAFLVRLRRGARELGLGTPHRVPPTSLLAPTGARRRVDVVDVPLAAVVEAGRRDGATVNDEVLVAVAGALGRLLASRGESLDQLVVSVPVSGRPAGRGGELGNAVGVLPVRIRLDGDRRSRLADVRAQRRRLPAGAGRGSSVRLMSPVFRALASVGLFQLFIGHQRLVHTFETNVRGPSGPLSLAGATVRRAVPVAVNPGNVTVSFDVLSAAGRLVVSIVSDPDRVPDHEVLRSALRDELTRESPLGSCHGNGAAPAG
ncbi:wax ester/triacylglycerol synthase domain-containing protein [Pedococcus sp. KACC 23699]|uniref:diacylglycerol O-acyltransferase n=1 Tax=Pedococcus sp. KACC 23699 TaxID=3149228 RepID=A0AAU7JQW7_9MICO